MESNLQQGVRLVLEDATLDVQSFISEETMAAQRHALEDLLEARKRDMQQKVGSWMRPLIRAVCLAG